MSSNNSLVCFKALLILLLFSCNPPNQENESEDFRTHKIIYTKHALCRMQCRHIDESEIKEIMQTGKLNLAKSYKYDKPCPSYALEGITHDYQSVRIIIADCENIAKIITVIDLKTNYSCNCN